MKKNWIAVTAAVMLLTGSVCGCSSPQKSGTEALQAGNYEEAEEWFKELTEKGGKDAAEGYRGLGMAYYEMKEYQKALDSFEEAAAGGIQPSVQMYNLMAICAMQTEEYASALEYIRSGLVLAESASADEQPAADLIQEMEYNEIICCEKQADWATANEKIAQYLEKYPDDENAKKESEFLATRQSGES